VLKYLGFKAASWLIPHLPVSLTYAAAWLAGEIAFRFARGPRRAATSNLRRVLGVDEHAPALQVAVRTLFRNAAYNYVDLFLLPRISPDELSERVEVLNPQALIHAYQQGRGVIIATAHLGNFDLLMQMALTRGLPIMVLVERLKPEVLFETVVSLRGRHGVRLLPAGPASLREVVRTLRAGGVLAIAADRDLQDRGVPTKFFGEQARLPSGAVDLAHRTGAALVPIFGLRLPGRRYRISVEPPLAVDSAAPLAALAGIMERYIREHPEQWVVFQPIWDREAGWDSPTSIHIPA
jgi:lauroyl/myristoyl acyltransferase